MEIVTKIEIVPTLMTMEPGDQIDFAPEDATARSLRNRCFEVGQATGKHYHVHVNSRTKVATVFVD